jgi:hypothetical protein
MNYLESIKRDHEKSLWLEKNSFTLIELYQEDVDELSEKFFNEKFGVKI